MALGFSARRSVLIGFGLLAWASLASAKMPQLEIATEDLPPFSMMKGGKLTGLSSDIIRVALQRADISYRISIFPWIRAYRIMMKGGKLTGLSSDIIRVALQRADISYRISIFPWIRAYRMATTQPDLCLYSTVRTAEREPIFKWVGPLVRDKWVVFVPADSPIEIASIEDLKRYRTASLPDDAITQFLQENGIPFDRSVTTESIRMLEGGRIDYWATTLLKGRYQANLDGIKLRMALVIKDEDMYLACNKAVPDKVVAALNDAIARMERDGTIARLSKPYQ